jgi:hypothetical protein
MAVNAGISKKRMEICSESLKKYIEKDLRPINDNDRLYGEHDTILGVCKLSTVKGINKRRLRWLAHFFTMKELVRAISLLFFNQKPLDV